MTYTLRQDIHLNLRWSRYPALLEFLVNTVAASSADTQLRLMTTNLLQTSPAETQRLQLAYRLPV
ncbi:hypothetical protein CCR75_005509 [Bremia lactucae]|uniref:Uncharacterized protein n=1 Tax=Bremia lactucae TaxID=4779 RepID=A0A976NYS9_BRELC|nr:hypothetical protein CCR75_004524 [Bremia lactucae]TDH68625.1 hypothetical protein CCR75_003563 [Bremia lactucae]TDH72923.1 hypothetical protein CCR75_005509 [Bremia lactucae]